MKFLRQLFINNKGATAIEYGLIAAMISLAAIAAMSSMGNTTSATFTTAGDKMAAGNAKGAN